MDGKSSAKIQKFRCLIIYLFIYLFIINNFLASSQTVLGDKSVNSLEHKTTTVMMLPDSLLY